MRVCDKKIVSLNKCSPLQTGKQGLLLQKQKMQNTIKKKKESSIDKVQKIKREGNRYTPGRTTRDKVSRSEG